MKRFLLVAIFCCSVSTLLLAQPDTCKLRITLLTCSPGEELYSTFGHTALRVQDSSGLDIVFNYGTFEFGPDFYAKFVRGKLRYFLSVENFEDFESSYRYESRSIREQEFQLSCDEKQKLFNALQVNALEENKYYLYDFLFDNCTTRARDIVKSATDSLFIFNNILPENIPTFRDLIHSYLDIGGQYWSKLGIDLLLGAKMDRKVSNKEAMFLPDYLLKGFDSATVAGRSLVTPPQPVLEMPSPLNKGSWFRPWLVFTVLGVIIILISFSRSRWAIITLKVFDTVFFLALGLVGILLLFMWFGTDHKVTPNNYNLLWALPMHVVMAFLLHSDKRWVKGYFRIVFWLTFFLVLSWAFLPQEMNSGFLPLVILAAIRSRKLSY